MRLYGKGKSSISSRQRIANALFIDLVTCDAYLTGASPVPPDITRQMARFAKPGATMTDSKNMHVFDTDITTTAELLLAIADHWPKFDGAALSSLAVAITNDLLYWRHKRATGSTSVSDAIRERRSYVNKTLFEMFKNGQTVPAIAHQETAVDEAPHVQELRTKEAANYYMPAPPPVARRPVGRPAKGTLYEEA